MRVACFNRTFSQLIVYLYSAKWQQQQRVHVSTLCHQPPAATTATKRNTFCDNQIFLIHSQYSYRSSVVSEAPITH